MCERERALCAEYDYTCPQRKQKLTSLMGAPLSPPVSLLFFDNKKSGLAFVVLLTIIPSIFVSMITFATSFSSSMDKSGASLTNNGACCAYVSRACCVDVIKFRSLSACWSERRPGVLGLDTLITK